MLGEITLDVVLYYSGSGYWVAHCVQLDLLSSDETPDAAWERSISQCRAQIAYAREHKAMIGLFRSPDAYIMEKMALGQRVPLESMRFEEEKITLNKVFIE